MIELTNKEGTKDWWKEVWAIVLGWPKLPLTSADGKTLQTVNSYQTGQALIDKNVLTDQKGDPINPEHTYTLPLSPIYVNFERSIRRAYKAGGGKEVVKYLNHIQDTITKFNIKS